MELDKLTSLYDLNLFSLNTTLGHNLNPTDYSSDRIISRYFSPHSFKKMKMKLLKDETISCFSVFITTQSVLIVTWKIFKLNFYMKQIFILMSSALLNQKSPMLVHKFAQHIYLATYLNMFQRLWRLGGVGVFIDESLDYRILEKTSNEASRVLLTQFSFVNKKDVICGIFYRQYNSPEIFQSYFDETIKKRASFGKH